MTENGVIIKGLGGLYTVVYQGKMFSCSARGIFRKDGTKPMIGDLVELEEIDENEGKAVIQNILPRKNQMIRPAVANVDQVIVVMATRSPAPDLLLIDKLLINARQKNIEIVMMINKTDQDPDLADAWYDEYRCAVPCLLRSCTKDGSGIEELKALLTDKISVLAGQSGAGKSSLLNLLMGTGVMATGELSAKTDRGRHTTRHNEMFMTNTGFIIDSPGFSLFEMEELHPLALQNLYPEIYNNEGSCFFPDCSHTGEPRCHVSELIEQGKFSPGRYERYKTLYRELKEREKNKYK